MLHVNATESQQRDVANLTIHMSFTRYELTFAELMRRGEQLCRLEKFSGYSSVLDQAAILEFAMDLPHGCEHSVLVSLQHNPGKLSSWVTASLMNPTEEESRDIQMLYMCRGVGRVSNQPCILEQRSAVKFILHTLNTGNCISLTRVPGCAASAKRPTPVIVCMVNAADTNLVDALDAIACMLEAPGDQIAHLSKTLSSTLLLTDKLQRDHRVPTNGRPLLTELVAGSLSFGATEDDVANECPSEVVERVSLYALETSLLVWYRFITTSRVPGTKALVMPAAADELLLECLEASSYLKQTSASRMFIERVFNSTIERRFQATKEVMKQECGSTPKRLYLYHGTSLRSPYVICNSDTGVDFRYSSEACKLFWGKGAYFTDSFEYALKYSHYSGKARCKQILLCEVLVGDDFFYGKRLDMSLKMPPMKEDGLARFGSVSGLLNQDNSKAYVIYELNRSKVVYVLSVFCNGPCESTYI